ncbi:MAG TPA: hypothetical protein VMZ91_13665 [Candidatus Paceibacterota bacterium]|nr:hypothetical protein [Candidatus Paceibacterota bacterium]
MTKEDIEVAEEHVKLAEDLVLKQEKNAKSGKTKEAIKDAAVSLERAETDLKEIEESAE